MTWAKLDDGTDEELEYLSHAAHRLFIDTITMSRRRNLGGILSPTQLLPLMRRLRIPPKAITELIVPGPDGEALWHRDGDSYVIRNYEKFNPLTSTERVKKHRATLQKQGGAVTETPMEHSLVRASATGLETISKTGSRPVPLPAPGDAFQNGSSAPTPECLNLAVAIADVLGVPVLAPLEIQACEQALVDFPYLIPAELVERAREHQNACREKNFPLARTVQGLWQAWRSQNDYNADHGRHKPRSQVSSGLTKAFS